MFLYFCIAFVLYCSGLTLTLLFWRVLRQIVWQECQISMRKQLFKYSFEPQTDLQEKEEKKCKRNNNIFALIADFQQSPSHAIFHTDKLETEMSGRFYGTFCIAADQQAASSGCCIWGSRLFSLILHHHARVTHTALKSTTSPEGPNRPYIVAEAVVGDVSVLFCVVLCCVCVP